MMPLAFIPLEDVDFFLSLMLPPETRQTTAGNEIKTPRPGFPFGVFSNIRLKRDRRSLRLKILILASCGQEL